MNNYYRILLIAVFLFGTADLQAQVKNYTVANAHSHNDYLNPKPFHLAYQKGFGSIEADVFAVNGELHVAHSKKEIKTGFTLKNMYLKPLLESLQAGNNRKLILLVDIKDDYKQSLPLLLKEVEMIRDFLNSKGQSKPVTIVVSGNRPSPAEFSEYPGYIFFDSDLKHTYTAEQWERVALVSLNFSGLSAWKAENEPTESELQKVKNIIDSVHSVGKAIRFWAAPDNQLSWQWQKRLGVELIGTDKINELASYVGKADD